MKKIITLIVVLAITTSIKAQTPVKLNINHFLGYENFEFFTDAYNNVGDKYTLRRMEYYISKVSITHDSGKVTDATGVYILANASESTSVDLGSFDITNVEAINFSVGVDPGVNNGDPTKFPSSHALAPKSPSMHWGWASGYRFVALEGASGENLNTTFQIHALGNQNYFSVSIPTSADTVNQELHITINADMNAAIEDISLDNGVVIHGDTEQAVELLKNFRDHVFTSTSGQGSTLAVKDIKIDNAFVLTPNPASNACTINIDDMRFSNGEIQVTDITGKSVLTLPINGMLNQKISIDTPGVYFVKATSNSGLTQVSKLVMQ